MSIPKNAQDATPLFIMLLRELADLQARCLTNQMVCERILELAGEPLPNIRPMVAKLHAECQDAAMRRLIERLRHRPHVAEHVAERPRGVGAHPFRSLRARPAWVLWAMSATAIQ